MWTAKLFCISTKLDCSGAIRERRGVEREKCEGKGKEE